VHIPHTIRTMAGAVSLPIARPTVRVSLSIDEIHRLVRDLERDARAAEQDGRFDVADSLDWRAAALREAAR
jgi:hypothetical protein